MRRAAWLGVVLLAGCGGSGVRQAGSPDGGPLPTDCSRLLEGDACDDGNPCTLAARCVAKTCVQRRARACAPSGPCASAAVCDSATGTCRDVPAPDGTRCDDGNLCSRRDVCRGGVCVGEDPITCDPQACHDSACDPHDGVCHAAPVPDGARCEDGDPCTQEDSCRGGTCLSGTPRDCSTGDTCRINLGCDRTTGECRSRTLADRSSCEDGNPCTRGDVCRAGRCVAGEDVLCPPLDACHLPGECDLATGACTQPTLPDGSWCDDGNACTTTDACIAGRCVGAGAVSCDTTDACVVGAACDPATGWCVRTFANDGTPCSDENLCTVSDTCRAGQCIPGPAVQCPTGPMCYVASSCDRNTGFCAPPRPAPGAACDDGDPSTPRDACAADGSCQSCRPDCTDKSCGPDGCGGACGTCGPGESCVFGGTCRTASLMLVHVSLPAGSPFRPESGVVLFDLNPVVPDASGIALAPILGHDTRLALFGVRDQAVLLGIVTRDTTELTLDARSTAEAMVFLTTGLSVFPPATTASALTTIDGLDGFGALEGEVNAALVAGVSPVATTEARAAPLAAALGYELQAFEAWGAAHPLWVLPDDPNAGGNPQPLVSALDTVIEVRERGRVAGFRVTANASGNAASLAISNQSVRAGWFVLDRPGQPGHVQTGRVDAAEYDWLRSAVDLIDEWRGVPGPGVVTPGDAPGLRPLALSPGHNDFTLDVVAPSLTDFRASDRYPLEYRSASLLTFFQVILKPNLSMLIGNALDGSAWECILGPLEDAYDVYTAAYGADLFGARDMLELLAWAAEWVYDASHWRSCIVAPGFLKQGFHSTLIGSILKEWTPIGRAVSIVSGLTNGILGAVSQNLNASSLTTFHVSACVPACNGVPCGDNGCGLPCPSSCPAGTTCDAARRTCVASCPANTCTRNGWTSGTHCDGSNVVTCASAGGCVTATAAACGCGCSNGACASCASCGNGVRDGAEACDRNDLGGKTCASLGLSSGTLRCTGTCSFDTSQCCPATSAVACSPDDGNVYRVDQCQRLTTLEQDCHGCGCSGGACLACTTDACSSGPCCDTSAHPFSFAPATRICWTNAVTEAGCTSTTCGSPVLAHARDQYCSGRSAACDGSLGGWKPWTTSEYCPSGTRCATGGFCETCPAPGVCGNGSCEDSEDPVSCYADCHPWLTNPNVPYAGGSPQASPLEMCSTAAHWHRGPNFEMPHWTYSSGCALPSAANLFAYAGDSARWSIDVKKAGRYRVTLWQPDATQLCALNGVNPASRYVGTYYGLADATGKGTLIGPLTIAPGASTAVFPSAYLTPGTWYLIAFDHDDAPAVPGCLGNSSKFVLADNGGIVWLGP